ncbi:hypothetical protein SAMN05444141_102215 [Pseudovibrio denitrificans]|uniref:Uncharacterized protein n=1 Tax=Pseudovibrio denitrificans TaxID=258256 RepID=A0A1I6ZB51_9HYPH|nr:hypothetical protein [Pseudovibrio denitrificans]SFT59923.1 hypothetical protein SAMN05444141_102215 [Pseudovibrio denitrificans]
MKKTLFGPGAITTFSAALLLASATQAAPSKNVSGEVLVPLNYIIGLKEDGSSDQAVTEACEKKYEVGMGKEIFVEYQISPTQNRAVALVEDTEVRLTPLGIPETYSFTSDKMPDVLKQKGFLRVIFTMEDDFDDEVVHIIAAGDQPTDKCFLSTEAFKLRQ